MKYCYFDLCEHMKDDNELIQRAENILKRILKEDPKKFYEEHLHDRMMAVKLLEEFGVK